MYTINTDLNGYFRLTASPHVISILKKSIPKCDGCHIEMRTNMVYYKQKPGNVSGASTRDILKSYACNTVGMKNKGVFEMAVITVTKDNFHEVVAQEAKPVLVDFWATWCGPCRMVSPIVDELSEELSDSIKVAKVNVDEEPELASQFGVMSIPTLVLVKGGTVAATSVGARPKEDIRKQLGI